MPGVGNSRPVAGWRSFIYAIWRGLVWAQNGLMVVLLLLLVLLVCRCWPHPELQSLKPTSIAVYDSRGQLLRLTLASDQRYRMWVPLTQMSPQLTEAVLLQEDRWFRWHPGFNPYGLLRGAWVTYVRGGNPQGGSTITMQLARSLWQLNTRTPWGKTVQIMRALQLEICYSKTQIYEAYLNDVPYGRNVEGAGTASLAWFGKPVAQLSLPETLTLAVMPQDPAHRLRSTPGPAVINAALTQSRHRLYLRWVQRHPEDAAWQPLFALPLALRPLRAMPFYAPHAVNQVLAAMPGASVASSISTTLDLRLQRVLEQQINRYVSRNGSRGVRNAAAVLLDTRDMGVRALVGSADFFNPGIRGQVNGTLARRSPGSTLKPFIYGLGFDQGVLHPQTVLRDVLTAFGPYAPENFDGRFLGPVTATDALNRSRNVPAVWVASQLHQPDLYQFLQQAGVGLSGSAQHYGLALVLGGGEVSVQQLAALYAMLANQGVYKPLRLRADNPQEPGQRLLSAEASYMVLDILRQHARPGDSSNAQAMQRPVYWKTGTSWSFRDAWTAGIWGPYVLVVWVGNFDNSANTAFVGLDTAAPLFFGLLDAIHADGMASPAQARPVPARLKRVQVCLASGDLPNQWCPATGPTWFIPGVSPIRVSNIHRPVLIDDATGRAACPPLAGKHTHQSVFEFWPTDMQQVFAQAGIPRRAPPLPCALDPGQNPMSMGVPPEITSPLRGSVYALRIQHAASTPLSFVARADGSAHTLYWFVNDAFVGQAVPGTALDWLPAGAGNYVVRVVDDAGRGDQRELRVELVR